MRFVHPIDVRYADTDAQARVFFANYLTYFDEANTFYLKAIGLPPVDLLALGIDFAFVDARCSWRGAARFGDRVWVACRTTSIGRTSVHSAYEVRLDPEGEPIATGSTVQVCVGPDLQKIPVPDVLREAVARYQDRD